jgi:hypothetical protein
MSENLPANIIALAPGIQMVGMAALLDESATLDDVALALVTLKDFRDKPQWGIGDLLNASELRFGEKYAQIFDVTGLEYSTCQTYTSMARSFKPEERNPDIGYAYHRIVQACSYDKRKQYLQYAIDNGLREGEFRIYVRNKEGKKKKKSKDVPESSISSSSLYATVCPLPFERNHLSDLITNPAAIRVSREQLEKLGIPLPDRYDKVIVIGLKVEEDGEEVIPADENIDFIDLDDDNDRGVPFGA